MRILLAVDGSAGADTARALVTGLSWPAGSRIEAVRVVEPVISVVESPGFAFVGSMEDVLGVDGASRALHVEVAGMARDGLTVTTRVLSVDRPRSSWPTPARAVRTCWSWAAVAEGRSHRWSWARSQRR